MRVNPLGWAYLEKFSSAQLNEIDIKLAALEDATGGLGTFYVDGRGGTYSIINGLLKFTDGTVELAQTAPLLCKGPVTIEATGEFNCDAEATFSDNAAFVGPASFTGNTTISCPVFSVMDLGGAAVYIAPATWFSKPVTFNDDVGIAVGKDLNVGQDVNIGRYLNVDNAATISGNTACQANLGVAGLTTLQALNCQGVAKFPGGIADPVSIAGVVSYSGTGRQLEATLLPANPGNATPVSISSLSYRHVWINSTSDVYAWNFAVADDAGDKEWIEFAAGGCTPAAVITLPGGATKSLNNSWCKARRMGGAWSFVASGTI